MQHKNSEQWASQIQGDSVLSINLYEHFIRVHPAV